MTLHGAQPPPCCVGWRERHGGHERAGATCDAARCCRFEPNSGNSWVSQLVGGTNGVATMNAHRKWVAAALRLAQRDGVQRLGSSSSGSTVTASCSGCATSGSSWGGRRVLVHNLDGCACSTTGEGDSSSVVALATTTVAAARLALGASHRRCPATCGQRAGWLSPAASCAPSPATCRSRGAPPPLLRSSAPRR